LRGCEVIIMGIEHVGASERSGVSGRLARCGQAGERGGLVCRRRFGCPNWCAVVVVWVGGPGGFPPNGK